MSRQRLMDALTVAGVLCALAVSVLVVGREFFPDRFGAGGPGAAPAASRSLWEPGLLDRLGATGWRSGSARDTGAVTIVEFADFQCPSCRGTSAVLRKVMGEQPGRVALAYHHFPLEAKHPHAFAAAVAFECAGEQGRAQAMHDALFARQDEIGEVPWSTFAHDAGVPEHARFDRCVGGEGAAARVRADLHLARALGMENTPTLLVGRTVVVGAMGPDSLRALLRAERAR